MPTGEAHVFTIHSTGKNMSCGSAILISPVAAAMDPFKSMHSIAIFPDLYSLILDADWVKPLMISPSGSTNGIL